MVPAWAPDGALLFISDRSGWWNLYREDAPGAAAALCAREAEFGGPAWVFGSRPFQVLPDGRCAMPVRRMRCQLRSASGAEPACGRTDELRSYCGTLVLQSWAWNPQARSQITGTSSMHNIKLIN